MATASVTDPHLLSKYIACAEFLKKKCDDQEHIPGANKLGRKCMAELKYLKSLSRRRGGYDVTHLKSSNLSHYVGVLRAAERLDGVTHILQAFSCPGRTEPLHIDVVAGQGHLWVKVIARKAQALHLIWAGQGQFGERDIVLQAADYLTCTKVHPVHFVDPNLVFAFYSGVTKPIANELRKLGICVLGEEVNVDPQIEKKLINMSFDSTDSDENFIDKSRTANHSVDVNRMSELTLDREIECDGSITYSVPSIQAESVANLPMTNAIHSYTTTMKDKTDESTCHKQNVSDGILDTLVDTNDKTDRKNSESTDKSANEIVTTGHSSTENNNGDKVADKFSLQNNPRGNNHKHEEPCVDSWKAGNSCMLSFIETELLINPSVNYTLLATNLVDNEINTIENIRKVNLDITALITLVSAVSHGGCYFKFREKILTEQAAEEQIDPVLPKMKTFIEGKQLFTCKTAADSFNTILETLGGKSEKERATDLLSHVTVVPDNPSFRASSIPNTGKIKDRSKVIFGTGDSLKAVTLTANSGFVRAAHHQGVLFAVYLHASRALTEQKEKTAMSIRQE